MSHEGDIAYSGVPSDINAPPFYYFDEFPELFEDYPELFGLSDEAWNMTVDQSTLDTIGVPSTLDTIGVPSTLDTIGVPSTLDTIGVPSNIEAQSDTTAFLQEPAPSTQVLPGAWDPRRPTWNCYRCDACGYTSEVCGDVTRHIRMRTDHDPWHVSVSWVGDQNARLAPGFINGEIFITRLRRLAMKEQERKDRRECKKKTQEILEQREKEAKAKQAEMGKVTGWVHYNPSHC
ncbi:hypothetical protein BGX38DRAFT_1290701 [Terfezia claveryi]|nr:hypothetical protein BGX38DRAFT_1290701 [Terfezia claveryi]